MAVLSVQYAQSTQVVFSWLLPCESRYFSVCATVKLITFLPLTVLTTQSLPRFPITCNLIIVLKFKSYLKIINECNLRLFGGRSQYHVCSNFLCARLGDNYLAFVATLRSVFGNSFHNSRLTKYYSSVRA